MGELHGFMAVALLVFAQTTDHRRAGCGKPSLAFIMLVGPELPRWLITFSSERGEEWAWTGLSRSESLLVPGWPSEKLSQPERLLLWYLTIFSVHQAFPYIPPKPLMTILTSCFNSLHLKGWKAPQNLGRREIVLIRMQSPLDPSYTTLENPSSPPDPANTLALIPPTRHDALFSSATSIKSSLVYDLLLPWSGPECA